jgi:ribonucleoside-triphosphate reductase
MNKYKVLKRDGVTTEDFNTSKIREAIKKAVKGSHSDEELNKRYNDSILDKIVENISYKVQYLMTYENKNPIPIEDIQDLVERELIKEGFADTAKAYILYRERRSNIRNTRDSITSTIKDILGKDSKEIDAKRENGNIDGNTAMGTMLQIGSSVSKNYYLENSMSKDIAKAHSEGYIHIHDLDFYQLTPTCCQIDFKKLAEGGFNTGHGFLREPNSISSYSMLSCIAIQSDQNDCHGGQSIPNFDYAMAEGVYKSFYKIYNQNLKKAIDFGMFAEYGCEIEETSKVMVSFPDEYNIYSYSSPLNKLIKIGDVINKIDGRQHTVIEFMLKHRDDIRGSGFKVLIDKENITGDICSIIKTTIEDVERDCYQAMEAFIHNLNTLHSRAGSQVPFSAINLGTDTTECGRMVTRNLLKALDAGLGHGETPIFPNVIFKVKDGVNFEEGTPNHDLLVYSYKVTGKRLYPNYEFLDAPFNLQYYKEGHPETEVATMGCRTRVMGNIYDPTREISHQRGNLSFTTINLPMLAIEAEKDEAKFYELLDKYLDLVKRQLLERFEYQRHLKVKNLPFLMGQGVWLDSEKLGPEDEVGDVLKHGSLSIGFIGLAETLTSLYGHHHGEGKEYWQKGYDIIKYMRDYCDKVSQELKMNFTLLATPSEGLCGTALKKCRAKYGIIEGVTDKDYLTNSNHIPVSFDISAAEKIRLEAPFHDLTNAGHIAYVEIDGDAASNPKAIEAIVKFMHDNNIGYGAINHPVDRDPVCGYTGVIGDKCPNCGREEGDVPFERIRRITGYLVGTLDRFNDAKRAEEADRVKHGFRF